MLRQVDNVVSNNLIDQFAILNIGVEDLDAWYRPDGLCPTQRLIANLEAIPCLLDFVGAAHVLQRGILVDATA